MTLTQAEENKKYNILDLLEIFIEQEVDLSTIDNENFHEKTIKEFISYCLSVNAEPEFIKQVYCENVEQVFDNVLN